MFREASRFCTYATSAIMNNFSHTIPALLRDRGRFLTSHADVLGDIEGFRANPYLEAQHSFDASRT